MIDTLHTILVVAFVCVTSLLLALSILHRVRVQRVVMAWRSGKPGRLPAWPILFVGFVVLLFIYAGNTLPDVRIGVFAGYLVGGLLWFAAVLVSDVVLVTEHGIVNEAGRGHAVVAWFQIFDYFEVPSDHRTHFVFIYTNEEGPHRRLEILVPHRHVGAFRRLVRARLEDRLSYPVARHLGSKALEG